MGYSERVCQICGISFNISRIRTKNEPQQAGWAVGDDYVVDENPIDPCKAEGCENLQHDDGETGRPEHIAGPGCTCTNGYSGWRISVEEMRDITSCVALTLKPDYWQPEAGDEDFEKEAFSCFLTGVSRNGVSEFDLDDVEPAKHGVDHALIENWFLDSGRRTVHDMDIDDDFAMPMHPKCFEVFKRASLRKFDKVDIDGLFLLRDVMPGDKDPDEVDTPRFRSFAHSSDLDLVLDQWYNHTSDTEYLAANPIEVPALVSILEDCKGRSSDVVFEAHPDVPDGDPFVALSAELQSMLLAHLGLKDVANLRLSSPAFCQLPQIYFRQLVLDQMPWVWELQTSQVLANETDWHRLWLKLSAADGGGRKDEQERWWLHEVRREAFARVQSELKEKCLEWGNPVFFETFHQRGPNYDEQAEQEIRGAYERGMWPGKKHSQINGLRNRRRVWEDVEEILRRIEVKNRKGLREHLGSLH